jgi:hypothetical protein
VFLRLATLALLGLAACRGGTGHPVRDGPPRPAGSPAAPVVETPDLGPPSGDLSRRIFFLGLGDIEGPLADLRRGAVPTGTPARLILLPRVEAAVRARYPRGTPLGALRDAVVVGASARSPFPPVALARLFADPELQRRALQADTVRVVSDLIDAPHVARRTYRIELLRVGEGPFLVDLKFTAAYERWAFPDGCVYLRFDPYPVPPPLHVSLFRGACMIEPEGTGSVYTELLILGTDITAPFFLRPILRKKSIDLLEERVARLWRAANP